MITWDDKNIKSVKNADSVKIGTKGAFGNTLLELMDYFLYGTDSTLTDISTSTSQAFQDLSGQSWKYFYPTLYVNDKAKCQNIESRLYKGFGKLLNKHNEALFNDINKTLCEGVKQYVIETCKLLDEVPGDKNGR